MASGVGKARVPMGPSSPSASTRFVAMVSVRAQVQLVVHSVFTASSKTVGERSMRPAPRSAAQRRSGSLAPLEIVVPKGCFYNPDSMAPLSCNPPACIPALSLIYILFGKMLFDRYLVAPNNKPAIKVKKTNILRSTSAVITGERNKQHL